MSMTEAQRAKLTAIVDLVGERMRAGIEAKAVIQELVEHHGARYRARWDGNVLSAGGVSSSCTWSADTGLLANWRKTAGLRLIALAFDSQAKR